MSLEGEGYPVTSDLLKPGDILFSRTNQPQSKAIRKASRPVSWLSAWSHVAFVLTPNIRFEAPGMQNVAGFYRRPIQGLVELANGGYAAHLVEPCEDVVVLRRGNGADATTKFWSAVNGITGLHY